MGQNGWHATEEEQKTVAGWIRAGLKCRDGIVESRMAYLKYNPHNRLPVTASVLGVALIGKFKGNSGTASDIINSHSIRARGAMPCEQFASALGITFVFANQLELEFIKGKSCQEIAQALDPNS